MSRPINPGLTARELEVLALVVQGQANKQICRSLSTDLQTVKNQLSSIYHKLGVPGRTAAAIWLVRQEEQREH